MDVFYLNLDRRPDRDGLFRQRNAHLPALRRASAVDGASLPMQQLMAQGLIAGELPVFTPGALGNALSHRALWDYFGQRGITATVAEDDAVFNHHFLSKSHSIIASLPAEWDVIFWGCNLNSSAHIDLIPGLKQAVLHFGDEQLGSRIGEFQRRDFPVAPYRLYGMFGTIAYTATPKGMQRMMQACFPLKHELIDIAGLNRQVWNGALDATLNKHYPRLNAYMCIPPLAWTENDRAQSDVVA